MPADHPCWCGEPQPLYDESGLPATCGGEGVLYCECGGDLCICHHHGEVDCPGCEECEGDDPDDDLDTDSREDDCLDCGVCDDCAERSRAHAEEMSDVG